MRWSWFLLSLLAVAALAEDASPEEEDEEVVAEAGPCNPETCKLPDCRCSSTDIPGNLAPRNTPQFVMVTFDDAVNVINIETYREVLSGRRNKNNCPVGATFYVSHEYTNYALVNEIYNNGSEIALHSITHRTPDEWWQDATVEDMKREFADQLLIMQQFGNIPRDAISGLRMPFIQMSGNSHFQMMKETGLTYDCSWPTVSFINPGLWPYTLDYKSTQDCLVAPPCPTASIPGTWVVPMVTWRNLANPPAPCSFVDACPSAPGLNDEDGWFRFIVSNFERHYLGNRAPFGYFVHEGHLSSNPAVKRAFIRFLDMINNLHDVFMVNTKDVVEWVKNPVPVNEYIRQQCKFPRHAPCFPNTCGNLRRSDSEKEYWMTVCGSCPRTYPWVNNPLGR
ncbi:hypothetical protein ABMA27_009856 [Loxostege sticticalis]|uniref:NodB homology domain-containing protein n=1 Tax=Loxostege sticticalis TaxID=481309 RepID=A0ABR3H796_LOXSC